MSPNNFQIWLLKTLELPGAEYFGIGKEKGGQVGFPLSFVNDFV
jgi:hypothetical protein